MTGVVEQLRADVSVLETDVATLKNEDTKNQNAITLNSAMIHTMQQQLDKTIGVAKDPDGNNVITFERNEIIIRDASGELVCRINNDVHIGDRYKNSPISAVREFFRAMEAFKALES